MDKQYQLLTAILLIGIFSIAAFYFTGIQNISNKKSYTLNEDITFAISDFMIYGCSCPGKEVELYRYEEGWKKKELNSGLGQSCVDGKIGPYGMKCDFISCSFLRKEEFEYRWDKTYYESKGKVNSCDESGIYRGYRIKYPVDSFEKKIALPGRYKLKYGFSESEFEVV
jgi:hypothetical protein